MPRGAPFSKRIKQIERWLKQRAVKGQIPYGLQSKAAKVFGVTRQAVSLIHIRACQRDESYPRSLRQVVRPKIFVCRICNQTKPESERIRGRRVCVHCQNRCLGCGYELPQSTEIKMCAPCKATKHKEWLHRRQQSRAV